MLIYLNYNRYLDNTDDKYRFLCFTIIWEMSNHWWGLNWDVLNFLGFRFFDDPLVGSWFYSLNSITAISPFEALLFAVLGSSSSDLWLLWFYWFFFKIIISESILEALRGFFDFYGVTIDLFSIYGLLFSSALSCSVDKLQTIYSSPLGSLCKSISWGMGSRFYALSSLPIIPTKYSILENITDMDENKGEE